MGAVCRALATTDLKDGTAATTAAALVDSMVCIGIKGCVCNVREE